MVDRRLIDGAQDPVRHVGWPGNLQKMPAAAKRHTSLPRKVGKSARKEGSFASPDLPGPQAHRRMAGRYSPGSEQVMSTATQFPRRAPGLRRSWLFLPGAERAMLERAETLGADVLIQELEDFTPPERRP